MWANHPFFFFLFREQAIYPFFTTLLKMEKFSTPFSSWNRLCQRVILRSLFGVFSSMYPLAGKFRTGVVSTETQENSAFGKESCYRPCCFSSCQRNRTLVWDVICKVSNIKYVMRTNVCVLTFVATREHYKFCPRINVIAYIWPSALVIW